MSISESPTDRVTSLAHSSSLVSCPHLFRLLSAIQIGRDVGFGGAAPRDQMTFMGAFLAGITSAARAGLHRTGLCGLAGQAFSSPARDTKQFHHTTPTR